MLKVLFISGSPRKGNTDYILNKIFESLDSKDKDIIYLRDKNISHCRGCLSCHKTKKCVIRDDMKEILEKLKKSKLIILGTPNYFDNVSALTKNFIDRCHPLYVSESLKEKKLILVMTGGGKPDGTKKYLKTSTYGFVKYLKFDLVGCFAFQALHLGEIQKNSTNNKEIVKIINQIKTI